MRKSQVPGHPYSALSEAQGRTLQETAKDKSKQEAQAWSKIRPVSVWLWETSVPGAHLEDIATQPSCYRDFNA